MKAFHLLLVLTLTAAAVIFGPPKASAAQHALIVAIGTYQRVDSLGPKDADIANATAILKNTWKFAPEDIAVLRDANATRRNILRTFKTWLIDSTRPGDRVVFYYSGHGAQLKDLDGDEADGLTETLAAYDTDADGNPVTGQINDDEIHALLENLQDRDVTLIIDSCHSGTISRSISATPNEGSDKYRTFALDTSTAAFSRDITQSNRVEEALVRGGARLAVWSASSASQYTWEQNGAGVFTQAFMEGVVERRADRNSDGIVTNAELLDYVRSATEQYCLPRPECARLGFTPELDAAPALYAAPVGVAAVPPPPVGGTVAPPPPPPGPVEPVVDVVGGGNSAALSVALQPAGPIHLGQAIKISVTGQRPAWLVLLDVNAKGEVVQLYPNDLASKHGEDGRISPGRPLTIPDAYYGFELRASEPAGKGAIIAVATEDAVPLEELLKSHGDFAKIGDPAAYLAELASRLRKVWTEDRTNRALRWSMAEYRYEIVP